jgi:hypothetical protein
MLQPSGGRGLQPYIPGPKVSHNPKCQARWKGVSVTLRASVMVFILVLVVPVGGSPLMDQMESHMRDRINATFDLLDLLVVRLTLFALLIVGADTLIADTLIKGHLYDRVRIFSRSRGYRLRGALLARAWRILTLRYPQKRRG